MGEAQRGSLPDGAKELPACFQSIRRGEPRLIAEEIYDTLLSLRKLIPELGSRSAPEPCPVAALGQRRALFVFRGVMTGRDFKALELFNTPDVRFVGAAAGVLEAVRLGAVSPMIRNLFFAKVQQVRDTLGNSRVASLRRRGAADDFYRRAAGVLTARRGKLFLEKVHSVQMLVDRAEGISTVWAFRIIEVPFHPIAFPLSYL